MNHTALYVTNRLSLRPPQEESLRILSELAAEMTLKKGSDLGTELAKVRGKYPTCTDFERNFPSMCFALATGVGKTRLMALSSRICILRRASAIISCWRRI